MGRLRTIGNRVAMAPSRQPSVQRSADRRMTGRALQDRRLRLWAAADGACAACGRLTAYPHGFELDHRTPLYLGGADEDANCQVLCNGPDGCHERKTAADRVGLAGLR